MKLSKYNLKKDNSWKLNNKTLSDEIVNKKIISEFGRYPHRNEVLHRESTEKERLHLEEGGQRFGQ